MGTYRMCRACDEIFPKREVYIQDDWDCDNCVNSYPPGPKSVIKDVSYTEKVPMANKTKLGAPLTAEDKAAWMKLFRAVDRDGSGSVSRKEISGRLKGMVGDFEWDDDDGDGEMDGDEFVDAMQYELQPSVRISALMYAKQKL